MTGNGEILFSLCAALFPILSADVYGCERVRLNRLAV